MSKCWYCNNELTSGDNPKHFGICNKCYDEMFKSGDTIIRSLTDKIAELQKQLEEKDKLIERLQGVIDKLRDKKFAGKTLVEAVNAVYEPLFKNKCDEVEEFKQQLHELPKKIVEYFYDEIRHRAILEDDYCPDHNLERKYGVRKCLLENIRTTILKKYGDKNESNND